MSNAILSGALRDEIAVLVNARVRRAIAAAQLVPINAQVGTEYTLVLDDKSKLVTLTNGAAIDLIVPDNATVPFEIGTVIDFVQGGAGLVTVDPAVGVTVVSKGSMVDAESQYGEFRLKKIATDTWLLTGDLA